MTRLHVGRLLKGEPQADLRFRHSERIATLRGEIADPNLLEPGDEVLAFLVRAPQYEAEAKPLCEQTGFNFGVLKLGKAEHEAYLARIDALEKLESKAKERGGLRPAELLDWLVGTAEDPATREEAIEEIRAAVSSLNVLASQESKESAAIARELEDIVESAGGRIRSGEGVRSIFLGAAFKERHRQRLTSALWATQRLESGDRILFDLVRSFDPEAARSWLKVTLRTADGVPDARIFGWLGDQAMKLESAEAKTWAKSIPARRNAVEAQEYLVRSLADTGTAARNLALSRQLMGELADLLERES